MVTKRMIMLGLVAVLGIVAFGCGSSGDDDAGDGDGGTTTTAEAADSGDAGDETTTTEAGEPGEAGDYTADELAEAIGTNLSSGDRDSGDLVLSDEEGACVGAAWVEVIGVDTLNASGLTLEELSEPGASEGIDFTPEMGLPLVDAFDDCGVDIVTLFIEDLTAGLSPDQQECAAENVDRDLAREVLGKTFGNQDSDAEFEALIADLTETCDLPGSSTGTPTG